MVRLISSVAVSGVGSFFLLTGEKPKAHGDHDAHHSEKHEEHEEKEEASTDSEESASSGDEPKEDSKDEEEVKEDSKEEKTEDSSSDSEGDGADTPDTSDDEVVGEDETNVKKIIPDAKGGNKKRLESKNSIKQGEEKDTADSPVKDKVRKRVSHCVVIIIISRRLQSLSYLLETIPCHLKNMDKMLTL